MASSLQVSINANEITTVSSLTSSSNDVCPTHVSPSSQVVKLPLPLIKTSDNRKSFTSTTNENKIDTSNDEAQSRLKPDLRRAVTDGDVANLLWTCCGRVSDTVNKSVTSPCSLMEFEKRHDNTHNGLLPAPTCYGIVKGKLA